MKFTNCLISINQFPVNPEMSHQREQEDILTMHAFLADIHAATGHFFFDFADFCAAPVCGAAPVIESCIFRFHSQAIRASMLAPLTADPPENCDALILELYRGFQVSVEYISHPGYPPPRHITVQFDRAFCALAPRHMAQDLLHLLSNPRDAYYLPGTLKMLASWQMPELEEILIQFMDGYIVNQYRLGIDDTRLHYLPSVETIRRELELSAMNCLRHYPTPRTIAVLSRYARGWDPDFSAKAQDVLDSLLEQAAQTAP